MKRTAILGIVLLLAASAVSCAQNEASVIRQADKMIADRQYASAYNLLDSIDPSNDHIDVLLKKEEIVLHYFTQSIMHRAFSLADLKEGEDLDSIRANFTQGSMFTFQTDSLICRLLELHPGDCRLLKGYADYYEALLDDYNSEVWDMYMDDRSMGLLRQAVGCGSANAASQLGHYYSMDMPDSAIHYYRQAVALEDTLWNAWYNLGVNEYLAEQYAEALPHVRRACYGYHANPLRADAARIVGLIYDDKLSNADSALHYYQLALKLDSTQAWNYLYLLRYYLKTNDSRQQPLLDAYWQFAIGSEEAFDNLGFLVDTYETHETQLAEYLVARAATATTDYERAMCHLCAGQAYEYSGAIAKAIEQYKAAIPYLQTDGAPEELIASVRELIQSIQQKTE